MSAIHGSLYRCAAMVLAVLISVPAAAATEELFGNYLLIAQPSPGQVRVEVRLRGDVDGNQEVNIKDAVDLEKFLQKGEAPPYPVAADANADAEVDQSDVLKILAWAMGKEPHPGSSVQVVVCPACREEIEALTPTMSSGAEKALAELLETEGQQSLLILMSLGRDYSIECLGVLMSLGRENSIECLSFTAPGDIAGMRHRSAARIEPLDAVIAAAYDLNPDDLILCECVCFLLDSNDPESGGEQVMSATITHEPFTVDFAGQRLILTLGPNVNSFVIQGKCTDADE